MDPATLAAIAPLLLEAGQEAIKQYLRSNKDGRRAAEDEVIAAAEVAAARVLLSAQKEGEK